MPKTPPPPPPITPEEPTPGQALREARLARGLTVRAAAALARMSFPNWAAIERGTRKASPAQLAKMFSAIGEPLAGADTPFRTLTLRLAAGNALAGLTPEDDALVRQLLPARGDRDPRRSFVDRLLTAAALARVRVVIRTDLRLDFESEA